MHTDDMAARGIGRFIVPGPFWFFVAVVVVAPLPYGAAHLWSHSLLTILVGIALVLWVLAATFDADAYAIPFARVGVPAALLAVVLIWILVQSSPATPAAWHHPLWSEARSALTEPSIRGAISLNPDGAPLLLARLGTYAAVFWLAMQYGRSARRANIVFWAIAITGLLYAVYGISAHLSGSGKILFAEKWAYQLSLTSTFVNRNHYAVFAGMSLITSFALAIRYLKRDASGAFNSSGRFLDSMENLTMPVFILTGICIVIGSALLLTQSRGGVFFTAAGLIVLVVLLQTAGTLRKRSSLALIGVLAVLGAATFAVSGGKLADRVSGNPLKSNRDVIHRIAMDAIADAPVTGHGAGSFPALFHRYRDADFPSISPAFAAAHNVYLEFAAQVGVIAAGLYFGLLSRLAEKPPKRA
jgi:O-antigen ligase